MREMFGEALHALVVERFYRDTNGNVQDAVSMYFSGGGKPTRSQSELRAIERGLR